jgi:hypothetical protein
MRRPRKRKRGEVTALQKAGIENIMSGKFESKKEALMDAGYSEKSAARGGLTVLQTKGARNYLENFETKARVKFGMTLESKLQDVYLDGLDADKPWGKNDILPDFDIRKKYADKIAEMLGVVQSKAKQTGQQFNFFMFGKKERGEFNKLFNQFVRSQSLGGDNG